MKLRNLILCATAAVQLFGSAAYAADGIELTAKANMGIIEIRGSAPARWGRRQIAIVVCRPSEDTDLWEMSESEFLTGVYTIKETTCEADGTFAVDIILGEDAPNGYYTVKAGASGLANEPEKDVRVLYADASAIERALGLVNSASDAGALKKMIDEYAQTLSLDTSNDIYVQHADSASRILFMLKDSGFVRVSDLQNAYDISLAVADIITADDETVQQKYMKYADSLGFDVKSDDFAGNMAAVAALVKLNIDSIGEYRADIGKYFECMTAIAAMNVSDRTAVTGILEKYADALNISLGADYKSVNKYELGKALVGRDFRNKAEIKLALEKRISELKKQSVSVGGGGGSSGGASGGTSTVTVRPSVTEAAANREQTSAEPFSDVDKTHWAGSAIYALCSKGVLSGMGNGEFKPDEPVTREQIARMLTAAFALPQGGDSGFEDVEEGTWYAGYIASAYASGVIKGIGNNEFGVGRNVSRQDLAVMLYRIMKNNGCEFRQNTTGFFDDDNLIGEYARDAVYSLGSAGIVSGAENKIEPLRSCTRAEAARLIYAVMNAVDKERESDEF